MTSMRSALVLVAGLAAAGVGFAQAPATVVPAQSSISFTFKEMGVPVDGSFKKFTANVAFDPKKPETGKIGFTIDMTGATAGAAETDAELPKPGFFNTAKFPTATFASTAIKAKGAGHFDVSGKMTVKGASKDVLVPVTLTQAGGTTTATGAFAIKRTDFKIGEGEWADTSTLADDVQVKFKIVLTGVGPL